MRTPIQDSSHAYVLGRQSDGKLIAAGCSSRNEPGWVPTQFAVARYDTGGNLDPSFGENGVALVSFPDGSGTACAEDLKVRPDDSIVLAGLADRPTEAGSVEDFAIVQLTADGQLDGGFGVDGRIRLHPGDPARGAGARAIMLEPDGRAVVAGYAHPDSSPEITTFAAARIETDGTLDTSFGEGGEVLVEMTETTPVPFGTVPGATVADLTRYTDGRVALVGTAYDDWGDDSDHQFRYRLAIARLNGSGQLDPDFSSDGTLVTSVRGVSDHALGYAVLLTADGRLTVGGSYASYPLVARFEEDGDLDPTFGENGSTLLDFEESDGPHYGSHVTALEYQADGKLVVTGTSDGNFYFAIARLNAAGSLDPSFGSNGITLGPPFGTDPWDRAWAHDLLLEPSGTIVVAGFATSDTDSASQFALARFQGDPTGSTPDRDHDGVPDNKDQCPDVPGAAPTGCPETPPPPPAAEPPRRDLAVRAIGDSVTAGFGYNESGKPVSLGRFLSTCVLFPSNDHCQSPDVIAYPAIWTRNIGNPLSYPWFANYAMSGSTPADWIKPRGRFRDELNRVVADDPDVIFITLGGNPLLSDFAFGLLGRVCMLEITGDLVRFCVRRKFRRHKTVPRLTRIYARLLDAPDAIVGVFLYHKSYPKTITRRKTDILFSELNAAIATAFIRARKQRPIEADRLRLLKPPSFEAHQCGSVRPWVRSIDSCIHPNAAGQRAYARAITLHLFPNGHP